MDQSIPYQQRLVGRKISVLILAADSTIIDDLANLMPNVLDMLNDLPAGMVVQAGKS